MKRLAALASAAFWILAVVVPLGAVLTRASAAPELLLDPVILSIAWATAQQALWSTLLSAAIGLPLGLWIGRTGSRLPLFWLALPYGVPTVVAATSWVAWLGRSGPLAALDIGYSLTAVIVAHVFFNAPWIALMVAQARAGVPERELEAAASLGAQPLAAFTAVTWPRVRLAYASGIAHVFSLCSMSFALVLILGGGPPVQTLETALYSRVRYGALDFPGAIACAIWELMIALVPWLLVLAMRKRAYVAHVRARPLATAWGAGLVAALFTVPYLAVFGSGFRFERAIWEATWTSLRIACLVSAGTVLVSLLTVGAFRGSRVAAVVFGLPAGISVMVLGLGFWLAYGQWVDPFEGSLVAIVVLQMAIFAPVAFRMFWPVARGFQPRTWEAALSLGASRTLALRTVEWPRWKAPVLSALGMIGAASLGELAAVSLFYSERLVPLPLLVSRWMGQYRFEDAQAVSAWLLVLAAGLIAAVFFWGELTEGTSGERANR